MERLTIRYLAEDIGCSKRSVQRKIESYLDRAPLFQIKQNAQANLIVDGTYFKGDLCLVLYYDNAIKYTQLYRFTDKERFTQISEDLQNLSKLGIKIESITCDGHHSILRAIKVACPDVIVQRCLVHIHRETNIWLRKRPIIEASRELKKIVNKIFYIETHNDKKAWINQFKIWFKTYESFINEKQINEDTRRWWYRHKDLRRAAVMIKNAIPNMFHFLDNPQIPKHTNSIESFFGHLKDTLSIHRGLSRAHKRSFIQWYLHYKNKSR